jgi:hypothetical protein
VICLPIVGVGVGGVDTGTAAACILQGSGVPSVQVSTALLVQHASAPPVHVCKCAAHSVNTYGELTLAYSAQCAIGAIMLSHAAERW